MLSDQIENQAGNNKLQLIILVVVCVLFAAAVLLGLFSGFAYGRSEITYQRVDAINQALQSFYKDEGKYPTQTQFFDQRILVVQGYLNNLPKPAAPSGACRAYSDFQYTQDGPQHFSLVFCLEKGVAGLPSGVHNLTNQGIAQ